MCKDKRFLKFLIPSMIGAFLFVIPVQQGGNLTIPVAVLALALAMRNMIELPGEVGLLMQANGEYEFVVVKGIAVLGPMIITAVCLLMTLSSKKVLFPWLISLFSLIIPLMLWVTNAFPM